MHAPGKPTLLVYGHHDVQPVDPLERVGLAAVRARHPRRPHVGPRRRRRQGPGVTSTSRRSRRSSKTVEKLPINLKLIVEGEEEIGSENLDADARARRATSRPTSCASATPRCSVAASRRSASASAASCIWRCTSTDPTTDLHSGSFGGGVPIRSTRSPRMIARLHDDDGRDHGPRLLRQGRGAHRGRAKRKSPACRSTRKSGSRRPARRPSFGEKGYSTLERVWARPTLDCNGISGGFSGEGAKTIIPARAMAKISCRLVPDQEPDEIAQARRRAPREDRAARRARSRSCICHGGRPYLAPTDHPVFEVAKRAFAKAFGRPTVFIREGGSIPFVRTIADATGKPCLLMGFGQPDENAHAPNEWLDLENFHLGIKSAAYLYDELSRLG